MSKSIFCVKHEWFDADGNKLESRCCTHTWHTSYRKASVEYAKRTENLYSNYPGRVVKRDAPDARWSPNDGSYELSASRVYDGDGKSYIRVVLAAVDVL